MRTLEKARALSAHSHHGEIGAVIEAALEHYAAHLEKRRFALGAKPRRARNATPDDTASAPEPAPEAEPAERRRHVSEPADASGQLERAGRSRYISAEVRRIVAARDGLRCSYRGSDGRRCQARHYLELDHRRPFALGGANSADNLRLLCRAHNQLRLRERLRPPCADGERGD